MDGAAARRTNSAMLCHQQGFSWASLGLCLAAPVLSSRPPEPQGCNPMNTLPYRACMEAQQQTQHAKKQPDLLGNTWTREMWPGRPSTAASAASWDWLKLCLSVLARPPCSLLSWRLKDGRSGAPRASASLFSSWLSSRGGRLASLHSACKHLVSFCRAQPSITCFYAACRLQAQQQHRWE